MKFQRLTKTIVAAVAALAITGLAQAGVQQDLASASVIEEIKKRGSLRVGMATFVPWAMRDKQGNLIGFEIDVAKKLPPIWRSRLNLYQLPGRALSRHLSPGNSM